MGEKIVEAREVNVKTRTRNSTPRRIFFLGAEHIVHCYAEPVELVHDGKGLPLKPAYDAPLREVEQAVKRAKSGGRAEV